MWTSGSTESGSSSVPARTNSTSGRPYSLKTATWQSGQRWIRWALPSSRGTSTGRGAPAVTSTRSASMSTLITNALPGLPLAVAAVAAMDEERLGHQPVANRAAGAATLTWVAHERGP